MDISKRKDLLEENNLKYLERKKIYKSLGYDVDIERDFIIEQAAPISGRIIEAGTGKGHFALALAKKGYKFVSFDISVDEQEFAKLNFAYLGLEQFADFRIENAEKLSFADNSFDLLFSVNVLHHLERPFDVMTEFIRILDADGRLVLSDFTKEGFEVIEKMHSMEGRTHTIGNVNLSDIQLYLIKNQFGVLRTQSRYQDVLIAKKVVNKKYDYFCS